MKPFMDKIDKAVQQMKDAAAFIAMQGRNKNKVLLVIPLNPTRMANLECSTDSELNDAFVSKHIFEKSS